MTRTFDLDPDWEATVDRLARASAHRELQPIVDGLAATCVGRPVDVIRELLVDAWARATQGGLLVNPRLDRFATDLSLGRPVVLD